MANMFQDVMDVIIYVCMYIHTIIYNDRKKYNYELQDVILHEKVSYIMI